MLTAVYVIHTGYEAAEPVAAIGSIAYAVSFVLFAIAAWPAVMRPA
jgi:hypothetical protein